MTGVTSPRAAAASAVQSSAPSTTAVAAPRPPVGGTAWTATPSAVTRVEGQGAMSVGSAAEKRKTPTPSGSARSTIETREGAQELRRSTVADTRTTSGGGD